MSATGNFVIDCSMTMAWCFQSEQTPHTQGLLARLNRDEALVPSLWPLEVANVLLTAERRGRLTQLLTAQFIVVLESLPIRVDEEGGERAFDHIMALARAHKLSSYDASYLDLAIRKGLPIATLDTDLIRAAGVVGITLL